MERDRNERKERINRSWEHTQLTIMSSTRNNNPPGCGLTRMAPRFFSGAQIENGIDRSNYLSEVGTRFVTIDGGGAISIPNSPLALIALL